ncbi:hypothetical protein, partial [Paenibacillus ehimensis]
MKRIISSVLSLILFFSLITPTLAAEKDVLGLILISFKTDRSKGSSVTNASRLNGVLTDKMGSAIGAINSLVSITDSVYGSVYNSVYRAKRSLGAGQIIEPVNLKPNDAPYQIHSEYDSVSTVSGDLSIRTTDMTITGKNGLSFSLTRQYSAAESTMYVIGGEKSDTISRRVAPIGVGWSWDLPRLSNGNLTLGHRLGRGTYPINSFALEEHYDHRHHYRGVGYPWNDVIRKHGEGIMNLEGLSYYFDVRDGWLVQIVDKYNNKIDFTYAFVGDWGEKVLKSISTEGDETINIDYHSSGITLTKGNQKVEYKLSTYIEPINGREVKRLTSIIDAEGRTTTYNYTEKPTNYGRNMNTRPLLLTKVDHPTGAS